jgi:hypothetical protein
MASEKTHGLLFRNSALDSSYRLNAPAASERGITAFLQYVNGAILRIGDPITLILPNTPIKLQNVYGFNRVYDKQPVDIDLMTRPRADIAAVAMIDGKFREVCYLTLDWMSNPSEIQYYSGLTFRADAGKIGLMSKDSEVLAFLREVVNRLTDVTVQKKTFFLPVRNRILAGRAAFGPLYKRENKKSKDNIDVRLLGKTFQLYPLADGYGLKSSNGLKLNDRDLNTYLADSKLKVVLSAEPVFSARFHIDGKDYKGVRVLLKPRGALSAKAEELPSPIKSGKPIV